MKKLSQLDVQKLDPALVWEEFFQISSIPRCSGQETQVLNYIKNLASSFGLKHHQESCGNVLVDIPAQGGSAKKTVVLQAHVDMVCEKLHDSPHDFSKDPITLWQDKDWITAKGTTLGADNGIGVAYLLAIMRLSLDKNQNSQRLHGPLKLLFTVDEEVSLAGASQFDKTLIKDAQYLINIDNSQDHEICIGCAGSSVFHVELPLERLAFLPQEHGHQALCIHLTGLFGGHSGTDMSHNTPNAILILNYLLIRLKQQVPDIRLLDFTCKTASNALTREALVQLFVPVSHIEKIVAFIQETQKNKKQELVLESFSLNIIQDSLQKESYNVLSEASFEKILSYIANIPHSTLAYEQETPSCQNQKTPSVSTSINFSSLTLNQSQLLSEHMMRYSSSRLKDYYTTLFTRYVQTFGAHYSITGTSSPWEPRYDSSLLQYAQQSYRELFGQDPGVLVIHAGLEPGVLMEGLKHIQAISLGVDLKDIHTPKERVSLKSVGNTWKLLNKLLERLD